MAEYPKTMSMGGFYRSEWSPCIYLLHVHREQLKGVQILRCRAELLTTLYHSFSLYQYVHKVSPFLQVQMNHERHFFYLQTRTSCSVMSEYTLTSGCNAASAANEADDDEEEGGDGNGVSNSEALSGLSVSLECPQVGWLQIVYNNK